jgi:hypothetical protein
MVSVEPEESLSPETVITWPATDSVPTEAVV